ncbi:MAG: type II secretion system minor pseudopilin, partial [Limisphaerales bacterium]
NDLRCPALRPGSGWPERLRPATAVPRTQAGSVLIGLLWCLALLTVLVVGLLHSASLDVQLTRHYQDRIQARYLALAGIERTKALLYQDARDRSRSGQSHTGTLFNDPSRFRDVVLGRGTYRVFRGGRVDEGGGLIFGVSDEESRLDLNQAEADALGRLPDMTPDLTPAILDWRDSDNAALPGGAERDYYASLQPPSQPRNGPLPSVRELLLVRGIPPEQFWGDDPHGTGLGESADDERGADGNASSSQRPGWVSFLTVHSGVRNVSATGQERINIQSADEASLTSVRGITAAIAKAIIAHRGPRKFESLADLLDVSSTPPSEAASPSDPGNPPEGAPIPNAPPSVRGPAAGGPKLIDQTLLLEIADFVTIDEDRLQKGVVNVNTASLEVLSCLPGVSRELAQAIIAFRGSNGFLANVAWLLRVPGMTPDIFKSLAPLVTARSETFRILAEGRVRSSGVRQRIQAIVRVDLNDVQTLAYREDNL